MAILSLPKGLCSLRPRAPRFSFLRSTTATTDVPFIVFPSHCLRPCFFHATRGLRASVARTISSDSSLPSPSAQKDDNSKSPAFAAPTFQQAIRRLQDYWASVGCAIMQCSNTEVGAGTMNPLTFLRVLGPEPWNVAYVEPSIRPDDSRYGDNPNRLQPHTQFQMENLSREGHLQKIVEAYSRPTRILRGKVVDHDWKTSIFGSKEELTLWTALQAVEAKIHGEIEIDDFVEISSLLFQPLEDFFNNVFVMVDDERVRKNRLALLEKIADLPRGIADLTVLPGF